MSGKSLQQEDFDFPILTVDGVVFQLAHDKLTVLLIRRAFEPFLGVWALPGVYIPRSETTHQALERALVQKTGISTVQLDLIEQPYVFDTPGRDPRGHSVTVMYMGLGRGMVPGTHTGTNNVQSPTFLAVDTLPKLAYDHKKIVAFAHNRLKTLAASTNVVASLMPKTFTFSELQLVYEAIFGKKQDKRNFRKKILALSILAEAGQTSSHAYRPAKLYSFRANKLKNSEQNF